MNIHNKWGLLNSLISILNQADEDAGETVLAKYFLSNFGLLDNVNIYDAAEQCYTTRAAIRRFCQSLGYDNFKALKEEAREYVEEGYRYYSTSENVEDYPAYLAKQIAEMAEDCNANMNGKTGKIADLIYRSGMVVFLVSDIYSQHCSDFQKQMIVNGKMIRIVGQKFDDNQLLQTLTSEDLLFVVSTGGFFERVIRDLISAFPCGKILMTSRHSREYTEIYDEVLYLCSHDLGKERTVYHMYAVEYCLNLIASAYQKRYKGK